MKFVFMVISILCVISANGQVFYKGANDKEFQNLIANGITFVSDENDIVDKTIVDAIRKFWTCSKFEIIEKNDTENSINSNTIVLGRITITVTVEDDILGERTWGVENALGLFSGNYLQKEEVTKYKSIGYIELNGFNQNDIDSSSLCFIEYAISGLNSCIEKIKNEQITGNGIKLYTGISNAINPQSSILRERILLIIDKTSEKVDFKKIENSGLKYRKISLDEFKEINIAEYNKYAVLYFAYNSFTEASVYNMDDRKLIFTWHYINAHSSFDNKDLEKIMKYIN